MKGGTLDVRTFTERARKVLYLSQQEAKRLGHNYVGTEHLLLGLVAEGEGMAAEALKTLGIPLTGLLLAALSGLTYAGFGLGSQRVMVTRSAAWVNRWVVTGTALAFLVLRPPTNWATGGRPLLIGGLYLAAFTTFLANTLYLAAVRRVGATRAGLYSTTEPVFTAVLAWLFLHETLSGGQMAGAALVMLGVLGLEGVSSACHESTSRES